MIFKDLTRQVSRAAQRQLAKLTTRTGIEAAGGGRRWDGASVLTSPQNATLAARGPTQARAAGQYMNTPLANRAVETWTSALVGKGWQARCKHPDTDTARGLNEAFEALVAPVLPIAARALVRDGEAFLRLHITADGAFRLKPVPAEQVDPTLTRDLGGGARIIAGIEFDASDEITAYHILPEAPGTPFVTYGAAVRVPARNVLHIFDPLFPGQTRGLSWLAPILLKLRDRDEASDALLMQLKTASLITGYVRDPDGSFAGFEGQTESQGSAINVALEPGAMRILPPGADVTFSNPGQGVAQAVDFLRAQDREIAAGVGLTFEALTGDLTQTNYSSARVGLLEFRRRAEMLQRQLIEGQCLRPLWRRWIKLQSLSGEITGADLSDFLAVRFVAPGWQWVDPRNEVEADARAIEAGLKSREEVVAGRGRDIDELNEEIARDTARDAGDVAA